jgi:DNA-binding protein HU-beta
LDRLGAENGKKLLATQADLFVSRANTLYRSREGQSRWLTSVLGGHVNKAQFIEALAARLGSDKKTAATHLDAVLDEIYAVVVKGEKLALTGFGSFEKRDRAARIARNPATGASVKVKKTSVPAFRAGAEFKAIISGAKKIAKVPAKKAAPAKKVAVAKAAPAKKVAVAKAAPARKAAVAKAAPVKKAVAAKAAPVKKAAAAKAAPVKKAAAAKAAPVKKAVAAKAAPVKKAVAAKAAPAKAAPAKKAPAKRAPAKKAR